MEPYVLTNGISVDEFRARLWAATRARFRFSLHAGDADTWLRVHPTSTAAQYDRLMGVIRTLCAAGKPGDSVPLSSIGPTFATSGDGGAGSLLGIKRSSSGRSGLRASWPNWFSTPKKKPSCAWRCRSA